MTSQGIVSSHATCSKGMTETDKCETIQISSMCNISAPADLVLVVERCEFPCHRKVLSQSSDYFAVMFTSPMMERHATRVELRNTNPKHFQSLLEHAYDPAYFSSTSLCENDLHACLALANRYQFPQAVKLLSQSVQRLLSKDRCLELFILGDLYGAIELQAKAAKFCCWHFMDITTQDIFLELPVNLLKALLTSESLRCSSEADVFEALAKWLGYDNERRQCHLVDLFSSIRLGCLPTSTLNEIKKRSVVQDSPECLKLIDDVIGWDPKKKHGEAKPHQKQFMPRNMPYDIYKLYGSSTIRMSKFFTVNQGKEEFNDPEEEKCHINGPALPCIGYAIHNEGKDLYFSGGEFQYGKGKWNLDIYHYDGLSDTWSVITQLPSPRRCHAMTLCQGRYMYILGGCDRHRCTLDTVEVYDMKEGAWYKLPPLHERFQNQPACSVGDWVYVLYNSYSLCHRWGQPNWTLVNHMECGTTGETPRQLAVQSCLSFGGMIHRTLKDWDYFLLSTSKQESFVDGTQTGKLVLNHVNTSTTKKLDGNCGSTCVAGSRLYCVTHQDVGEEPGVGEWETCVVSYDTVSKQSKTIFRHLDSKQDQWFKLVALPSFS